jgi:hypothetical protein
MFIDKRHSSYSIHQIGLLFSSVRNKQKQKKTIFILVQMGNSEGKEIGQWFGPNTIAQVLRYKKKTLNQFFE